MSTKTISIELDVYERLKRAKRSERESFSSVLRRATWPDLSPSGRDVLHHFRKRMERGEAALSEHALDALDEAQRKPRRSAPKGSK